MTTHLTLDAIVIDLLANDRSTPQRSALVEQFRQQRRKPLDALARAELLLLEAVAFDHEGPMNTTVDQLEWALQVFEANDRPDRAAMCLRSLAKSHVVRGQTAEGLECGWRALAIPEIDVQTRLGLTHAMLPGLAELLCFDEAMNCLRRDFLPYMSAARPSPRLAVSWTDAAFLHVLAAMRIAKLQSIFTMDMDDTVLECNAEIRALMCEALDESKDCLRRARDVGVTAAAYPIAHTQGMIEALEGQCEAAFRSFGLHPQQGLTEVTRLHNLAWSMRINGRYSEALPYLASALCSSLELGSAEFERASQHELALCFSALGDSKAAFGALSRFADLQARASVRVVRPSLRRDALPDPLRSTKEWPVRLGQIKPDIQARRTVPPYVAKARRLFKETLGKRLSLSEMAARSGTGPRSLQIGLNEYMGTTFGAAYRAAAMKEACRLLSLTVLSIGEIAERVGYQSRTTFSRDYKAFSGLSPKEFRAVAASRSMAES